MAPGAEELFVEDRIEVNECGLRDVANAAGLGEVQHTSLGMATTYANKAFIANGVVLNFPNNALPESSRCEPFSLKPFSPEHPCTVLVVGSCSLYGSFTLDGVSAVREHAEIARAATAAEGRMEVLDYQPLDVATFADVLAKTQPDILIIASSPVANGNHLRTATGDTFSTDVLVSIVSKSSVEVLMLSVGESQTIGRELIQGADQLSAVACYQVSVSDDEAVENSLKFITCLIQGRSLLEIFPKLPLPAVTVRNHGHERPHVPVTVFTKPQPHWSIAAEVPFYFAVQHPLPPVDQFCEETAHVQEILELQRYCVVTGPSGSGKTALATFIAHFNRKSAAVDEKVVKCLYINVCSPRGHTWAQFVAGLMNLWTFRVKENMHDIGLIEDSATLGAFLDKYVTMVTIDNSHLLKQSPAFLHKLARVLQRVQRCKLLLLSQVRMENIGGVPVACHQKRGFTAEEAFSLFVSLHPKVSLDELEGYQADLLQLRDLTDGHVSAMRHIMLLPNKIKRCLEGCPTMVAERVLKVCFEELDRDEKDLLKIVSLLKGHVAREWVYRLATLRGCSTAIVDRLCSSLWLTENYDAGGGLPRHASLIAVKEFEKDFLLAQGTCVDAHVYLSSTFDQFLSPRLFYDDFDALTPEEFPFFPDHMESAVEKALHVVHIPSLPRIVGFDALLQMVHHFLFSGDLKFARRACKYLLVLERLLYKYSRGTEALFYVDMCIELLAPEEIFAQFKVQKIRTAITEERWDTAATFVTELILPDPLKAPNNFSAIGTKVDHLFKLQQKWLQAVGHEISDDNPGSLFSTVASLGLAGNTDCGERDYTNAVHSYAAVGKSCAEADISDKASCNFLLAATCAHHANASQGEILALLCEAAFHLEYADPYSLLREYVQSGLQHVFDEAIGAQKHVALLFGSDSVTEQEDVKLEVWQRLLSDPGLVSEPYILSEEEYFQVAGGAPWTTWKRLKATCLPRVTDWLPGVTFSTAFERAFNEIRPLNVPEASRHATRMIIAAIAARRLYTTGDIKIAVVSTDSSTGITEMLDRVGVDTDSLSLFTDNPTEAHEVQPSPGTYRRAIARLGATVENCVVIESNPLCVKAAAEAGARCLAVVTSPKGGLDYRLASGLFFTDEEAASCNPFRLLGWALGHDASAFRSASIGPKGALPTQRSIPYQKHSPNDDVVAAGAPSLAQLARAYACDAVELLWSTYPEHSDWTSSGLQLLLAVQVQERLNRQGLAFYVPRFLLQENGRPLPITEPLGFTALCQDETVAAFSKWLHTTYAQRHEFQALLVDVDKEQRLIDAEGLSSVLGFVELTLEFFAQAAGYRPGGGPLCGTSSNESPAQYKRREIGDVEGEGDGNGREERRDDGKREGSELQGIPFVTYALLVGIQKTNDLQQLTSPYNDVAAMATALRGLFENNIEISIVTDDGPDNIVTEAILTAQLELATAWFKERRNGQFLFFYSGHGTSVPGNLYGRFLLSNVAPGDAGRAGFGMEQLYNVYNCLQNDRQMTGRGEFTRRQIPVLVILDCCNSGVVLNSAPSGLILQRPVRGQACLTMMCACDANRGALEVTGLADDLGLFTANVIREINGIAEDNRNEWAHGVAENIVRRQEQLILHLRLQRTYLTDELRVIEFATYPNASQRHLNPCFMFSRMAGMVVAP